MVTTQPVRMCVSCHNKLSPSELRRFVNIQGVIELDDTIKQPGRGYYVCSDECLEKFKKLKLKTKNKKGNN